MSWPAALRQRAFLAPAGHAAVDEFWVARQHHIGSEPEPLHHAGPKTLDQRVGIGEQVEHLRNRCLVLEVELDDLAAARCDRLQILLGADAVERDDFRAHVRQQHAGERAGADAGEFDDAETCQRAGGAGCGLGGGFVEHVVSTVFVNWLIKLSRLRRRVASSISGKCAQKQNGAHRCAPFA